MPSTTARPLPEKYLHPKKLNPEYIALWESYLDEGFAIQHVAEVFGVNKHTVRRHYPGRGWTHRQVSAHGGLVRRLNETVRKNVLTVAHDGL